MLKRFLVSILLFAVVASASAAQEAAPQRSFGLLYDPVPTVLSAVSGYFRLPVEAQLGITDYFGAAAQIDLTAAGDYAALGIYLGPQVNFLGQRLGGLILSVQPGFMVYPVSASGAVFALKAELGYQFQTDIGPVFGVYTGFALANDIRVDFGVRLGFAFEDAAESIASSSKTGAE